MIIPQAELDLIQNPRFHRRMIEKCPAMHPFFGRCTLPVGHELGYHHSQRGDPERGPFSECEWRRPGEQGSRLIPLRRRDGTVRAYAVVDAGDFEMLMQWSWHLDDKGYARRATKRKGKSQTIKMHRQIAGERVDHIDRDRLNNRRANLRPCTQAENLQNQPGRANSASSGRRGVCWRKDTGKWSAQAQVGYKRYSLGSFATVDEADAVVKAFRAANMPFSEDARA